MNWIFEIDKITSTVKAEFGSMTDEQLNWRPDDKSWSIAQVLDHLITINTTYFDPIEQLQQGTYQVGWMGKVGFLTHFFGKVILKGVSPDRKTKTKTFAIWEPSSSAIDDIITKFSNHQEDLKTVINKANDLIEHKAVIASPANKNIMYKLDKAFDIIVTHELRHIEQARAVVSHLKG